MQLLNYLSTTIFSVWCPCPLLKKGYYHRLIDNNGMHLVWVRLYVIACLRLAKIFLYSMPCFCITFSFAVGGCVNVFSGSLLSGILLCFGKSYMRNIHACQIYPFVRWLWLGNATTYYLHCYRSTRFIVVFQLMH